MSNEANDGPDTAHLRPVGVGDTTVEALGSLSKALETVERARGHLYAFHQLSGGADLELDNAVGLLRIAGHHEQADLIEREVIGRDVIPGHWTFQIVEAYNRTYYGPFAEIEAEITRELIDGRTHVFEAEMRQARRPRPGHSSQ